MSLKNSLHQIEINEQNYINSITNLNINNHLGSKSQQAIQLLETFNLTNTSSSSSTNLLNSSVSSQIELYQDKSKFKTIKIFLASNKNEFANECECFLQEIMPELQQYFMQFGYDFLLVDYNLNFDFDPFLDPHLFECMLKEIDDSYKHSDGCFFIGLLGNKLGTVPLPCELSSSQYETVRSILNNSQDLELFQYWYQVDETSPATNRTYKLRPFVNSFPNIYNKNPQSGDVRAIEIKSMKEVNEKLAEIMQLLVNTTGKLDASKQLNMGTVKPKSNTLSNQSGLEQLINHALKYSTSECLLIHRFIENSDAIKRNLDKYLDQTSSNRIDKSKEEKQAKLIESVLNRIDEDKKHEFKLKWKDKYEDVTYAKINSDASVASSVDPIGPQSESDGNSGGGGGGGGTTGSSTGKQVVLMLNQQTQPVNNTTSALDKFDAEYQIYLESFLAIFTGKLKNLIDKSMAKYSYMNNHPVQAINLNHSMNQTSTMSAVAASTRLNELNFEITKHMLKLEHLAHTSLYLDSDDYVERFRRFIHDGARQEHHPICVYGLTSTGKSSLIGRFAQLAAKIVEEQERELESDTGLRTKTVSLVRFLDLTTQCSTFEGTLLSICEQLTLIDKRKFSSLNDLKSKDLPELIDYFYQACVALTRNSTQQLFIYIDGLHDINVEKAMLNKSSLTNNQIAWLFHRKLPAGCHLIVSVKRQPQPTATRADSASTAGGDSIAGKKSSTASMATIVAAATAPNASVSLFLYLLNEHLATAEVDNNFLFETPLSMKKLDMNELISTVKNKLANSGLAVSDDTLRSIFENFVNGGNNGGLGSWNHYYLNFVFKDLLMNNRVIHEIKSSITDKGSFPKDIETYVKYKIDSLEKNFNPKMLSIIFNYISASHNGITEMELIDLMSCNNDFFIDFYAAQDLPQLLRFPIAYWIFIKCHLGNLLCEKYIDNKVTYYWSNEYVKKHMKQRYLSKVDQIRTCHKDMANYFLESFVESKPLVDMSRNMQIRDEDGRRFIAQQPLVYSDTRYNYRRMSELWYHLMNSGDIQRLKEYTFFNFEYLLAKCHGMSLQVLFNDIDTVLRRILDIDVLLMSSMLRRSTTSLSHDPMRLASEILARLRPLQEEYGEHVKSLVSQALEWSESNDSPVLVPYSTWLDSPETLLITKIEHSEGIQKIAVTSFNQHVFFSTQKNEICMYHIPSKKLVRKFNGHSNVINFLLISHNNRYLISGSSDKLIKVWNLGTGEIENTFTNHKSAVLCAVLTHSDEYLITGTYDRLLNKIRVETGDVVFSVEKHFDSITALAISSDDSILVSASLDKSVKRWSIENMEVVDTISTIYSPITNIIITNDKTFIIIGCENNSVHVKSLLTGTDLHDLTGHNSKIASLVASPDCQRVYVGCADSKLYLYDIKSKELIAVLIEQEAGIHDLKLSSDNSFLFSSSGNSLYVLNLKKKKFKSNSSQQSHLDQQQQQHKLVKTMAMSREGDMAISGDTQGQVSLWNLTNGELIETIIESTGSLESNGPALALASSMSMSSSKVGVCQVALSNSHIFSVIAFNDNTVSVYDNELGDVVTVFNEHQSPVKHLFILEDGRRIFTSDGHNSCKIWVAHTGQLLESITVACNLLAISPDIKYIVSGPGENVAKIWTLSDAKVIRSIDHPNKITVITFTYDSAYVITGGEDCSCKIWELATGKLNQVLIEHEAAVTCIAVPLNNNIIASGAKDKLVLIWNFKDGSVIHRLTSHTDIIVKVAMSHDGAIVVSASKDGLINLWATHSGNLITSVDVQHLLSDILVSHDGSHIVARLEDAHSIPIMGLTRKWCKDLVTRSMSQSSLKSLKSFEQLNKEIIQKLNKSLLILPVKPKPPLFMNKSATLSKIFSSGSEANFTKLNDLFDKNRKQSEPSTAPNVITADASSGQNNTTSRGILPSKQKRKTKKASDFSSSASMSNNEEKHRKTKICCLL